MKQALKLIVSFVFAAALVGVASAQGAPAHSTQASPKSAKVQKAGTMKASKSEVIAKSKSSEKSKQPTKGAKPVHVRHKHRGAKPSWRVRTKAGAKAKKPMMKPAPKAKPIRSKVSASKSTHAQKVGQNVQRK